MGANVAKDGVIIIPCGSEKRTNYCQAGFMYLGQYHRACLAYARSQTRESRIFILSAKYGLLTTGDYITPYDLKMTDAGAVTVEKIYHDAVRLRIYGMPAMALGGRAYVDRIARAWAPHEHRVLRPFDRLAGIGYQLQWLKQNTPANIIPEVLNNEVSTAAQL